VEKVGLVKTYIMLLKGFIGTGILYIPKNYLNGGWGFSFFAMTSSYVLAVICALKLLDARKKCGGTSFSDIGVAAYGNLGRILVDIALIVSQVGFTTAFIYFIVLNL
jgi:solute carrier family 36 (proton-coupled amino acid transporter)